MLEARDKIPPPPKYYQSMIYMCNKFGQTTSLRLACDADTHSLSKGSQGVIESYEKYGHWRTFIPEPNQSNTLIELPSKELATF